MISLRISQDSIRKLDELLINEKQNEELLDIKGSNRTQLIEEAIQKYYIEKTGNVDSSTMFHQTEVIIENVMDRYLTRLFAITNDILIENLKTQELALSLIKAIKLPKDDEEVKRIVFDNDVNYLKYIEKKIKEKYSTYNRRLLKKLLICEKNIIIESRKENFKV